MREQEHPLLLLQENFIPGFRLICNGRWSKDTESISEGFSRKRWKGCESAPKQLQFTVWLNSMTPGQWQFPITCWAAGSGGLGADSRAFPSPLLWGHDSLKKDEANSYGDQSQPAAMVRQHLWIIQRVALALPKHFCCRRMILSTHLPGTGHFALFRSRPTTHSAGGLFQETHAKPRCTFLVGGLVGPQGHRPSRGSWGWPFCSPGEKLPMLCPELYKILQEFI